MPRQSVILKWELAEFVLGERQRGRSAAQIAASATDELAHRGVEAKVSSYAVKRHLATLDAASVGPAHVPATAERNASVAFDVAGNLGLLDGYLRAWIEQANLAVRPVQGVVYDLVGERIISAEALGASESDEDEHRNHPVVQVYEVDWQARKAAASELRQAAEATANLLARIHDAENVKAYQEAVNEAIAEASPEVANAVLVKMKAKQTVLRANLLGAAA